MKPALMTCFSRSGGTLLSRIIGTDPSTILVSEINFSVGATPDHKEKPPQDALAEQLQQWYGIHIDHNNFTDAVHNLVELCQRNQKKLIFRDWIYIDFYPNRWNNNAPSHVFQTYNLLDTISDFEPFALTRNAIDVYLSMGGDLETFSYHYLQYVKKLTAEKIPVIKYEDLTANPTITMDSLRKIVGDLASADPSQYYKNQNVTGDVQLGKLSRGNSSDNISKMARKWIPRAERKKINNCSYLIEANRLLGYSESYEEAYIETFQKKLKRKVGNRLAAVNKN